MEFSIANYYWQSHFGGVVRLDVTGADPLPNAPVFLDMFRSIEPSNNTLTLINAAIKLVYIFNVVNPCNKTSGFEGFLPPISSQYGGWCTGLTTLDSTTFLDCFGPGSSPWGPAHIRCSEAPKIKKSRCFYGRCWWLTQSTEWYTYDLWYTYIYLWYTYDILHFWGRPMIGQSKFFFRKGYFVRVGMKFQNYIV